MPGSDPAPIRGRWTIRRPDGERVEVFTWPDEAAIERGAKAMHVARGLSNRSYGCPGCQCRELALAVLRAALEAPEKP